MSFPPQINSNTNITLNGTNDSILNIGSGGTLGTAAYVNTSLLAGLSSNNFTGLQTITVTTEQLRLRYDISNYLSTTVNSSGGTVFQTTGTGGSLTLKSSIADGASAIGSISDTSVTLTNATSKLHSFKNNTVEKAFINYLGDLSLTGGSLVLGTASGGGIEVNATGSNLYLKSNGLSFFNTTPVVQQSLVTNASISHNLGIIYLDSEVEPALNDLGSKINSILTVLKNYGLMAST